MFCISLKHFYVLSFFFFFNDTATTEIYTLSLHDALPICRPKAAVCQWKIGNSKPRMLVAHGRTKNKLSQDHQRRPRANPDRKSTRLNSSHSQISYAVFCLKKKKKKKHHIDSTMIKYDLSN